MMQKNLQKIKKQNFRLIEKKYLLDKGNRLFIKMLNINNQTEILKIPYLYEAKN